MREMCIKFQSARDEGTGCFVCRTPHCEFNRFQGDTETENCSFMYLCAVSNLLLSEWLQSLLLKYLCLLK